MSTEGKITEDGRSVIFPAPEMEGVQVEVQHSVKSGKPFTAEPGLLGAAQIIADEAKAAKGRAS